MSLVAELADPRADPRAAATMHTMTMILSENMDVSKNRGKTPKMDGENNGKTLLKWMIWWYHNFRKHPYIWYLKHPLKKMVVSVGF